MIIVVSGFTTVTRKWQVWSLRWKNLALTENDFTEKANWSWRMSIDGCENKSKWLYYIMIFSGSVFGPTVWQICIILLLWTEHEFVWNHIELYTTWLFQENEKDVPLTYEVILLLSFVVRFCYCYYSFSGQPTRNWETKSGTCKQVFFLCLEYENEMSQVGKKSI